MKLLRIALLCAVYAALDLYLLLGWLASGLPSNRTQLWHQLFGPLAFDVSAHPDGYGFAFLTLSCLATVAFFGLLVRMNRGTVPADPAASDQRR
jgi:hypothetical protein